MQNIRDIRKRIKSVKNLQQLTRAMQMISAVKFRKALEKILAARPYSWKLRDILDDLSAGVDRETHPLFRRSEKMKKVEVVVITGEKGMCGGFNTTIIKEARAFIEKQNKDGIEVSLNLIGRKAKDFYRKKRLAEIRKEYEVAAITAEYAEAMALADELAALFVAEETDGVYFVYNEFKSAMVQPVVVESLLPLGEIESGKPGEPGVDYKYEPDREAIFSRLLPRHLRFQVYRILLEAAAAEHAARMTAMDNATKNAGEMIDSLTLYMNKVRQAAITRELIEIVSSAEALSST